jgi:hypothetical protein
MTYVKSRHRKKHSLLLIDYYTSSNVRCLRNKHARHSPPTSPRSDRHQVHTSRYKQRTTEQYVWYVPRHNTHDGQPPNTTLSTRERYCTSNRERELSTSVQYIQLTYCRVEVALSLLESSSRERAQSSGFRSGQSIHFFVSTSPTHLSEIKRSPSMRHSQT